MRASPTVLVVVLALAAAASSVVAWHEYWELVGLRSTALMPEERQRLQKAAWDAAKRARQLQAQLDAARSAREAGVGIAPGTEQPASGNRTLGDAAADFLAKMEDPEIRRLRDILRLAAINRQNAAFYASAKLTPSQVLQFQHLLLERQNAANDVLLAATQQGVNPMQDPAEFRQMVQSAQAEVDGQIKAALGPDTYAQFQTFQQTQNQLGTINQLSQDLSTTETPLSDSQKQQMTQVMAQANPEGGSAVNDKAVQLAQGVLSAPQLQALQSLQQLQQVNSQLQSLINQNRNNLSPPPPPTTPGG
jgi:hypothetical protein